MAAAGQMMTGLIIPTLLESATTTTCLVWRVMARNTAASSASIVVAPAFRVDPANAYKDPIHHDNI